jgi:hypothetical protein
MVDDFASLGAHNYPVHTDKAGKTIEEAGADGVKSVAVVVGVPFVTDESAKIVEVNEGILILRELDSHKGMIVFTLSIEEKRGE